MEEQTSDAREGIENALDLTNEVEPVEVGKETEPDLGDSPAQEDVTEAEESAVEPDKAPSERTQKRIQRLVSDKKAAMEYGEYWKQKYEEDVAQKAASSEPVAPPPSEPKLEDFDYDYDRWASAVADYNSQVVAKTVEERMAEVLAKQSEQQTAQQRASAWAERVAAFEAQHDDFTEVVSDPTVPITQGMAEIIQSSENGPAVAYHLGNNPAEAHRIAQLPASMQAFELGKIEVSLAAPPKPTATPKQTTQAPAPLSPVSGQQPSVSHANESMEDFMKRRREEVAKRERY